MTYDEIVALLSYACGHDLRVRIATTDGGELIGTPTSVDPHPTANEVYLRPLGLEETEIGIGLGQVESVEVWEA